ncbi:hypothetical protein BDV97DRAFT_188890 [Delphinella strobiligena]|nr:hypothetical protein BDV97DRAFT_188890 [Delphinella strobiligena]
MAPEMVYRPLIRATRNRIITTATRPASTTTTTTPTPTFLTRNRRAIIWSSTSLALGLSLGSLVSHTIAPPPHPYPHTHQDQILMQDLDTRIDAEFKTKVLRGKCTAAAANLRGEAASWSELPAAPTEAAFVGNALAGARGLGVERLFWNAKEKELVAVVWFGGAMSGWPGVTHGGCIATVMTEKMALAARLARAEGEVSREVVAGSADIEEMTVTYKKPTYANAFYVVRMLPRHGEESGARDGEVEVDGVLETLEGKLCVATTGTVPVSGIQGTTQTPVVGRAKSWIGWPSRSQPSP